MKKQTGAIAPRKATTTHEGRAPQRQPGQPAGTTARKVAGRFKGGATKQAPARRVATQKASARREGDAPKGEAREEPPTEVARRRPPRGLPKGATAREPSEPGRSTEYVVGGRLVARVLWHPTGHPAWSWLYDAEGKKHGAERYYYDDGKLQWEAHHVHGLQHGPQREWNHRGRLVCETHFVRGTGRDLWCGGGGDGYRELREYVDGERHGVEQWWSSAHSVNDESWWYRGREHGIARQWRKRNLLSPDFPKFYIHGQQVTREEYLRAAVSDPTLRPYAAADDRPTRVRHVPPSGLAKRRVPAAR